MGFISYNFASLDDLIKDRMKGATDKKTGQTVHFLYGKPTGLFFNYTPTVTEKSDKIISIYKEESERLFKNLPMPNGEPLIKSFRWGRKGIDSSYKIDRSILSPEFSTALDEYLTQTGITESEYCSSFGCNTSIYVTDDEPFRIRSLGIASRANLTFKDYYNTLAKTVIFAKQKEILPNAKDFDACLERATTALATENVIGPSQSILQLQQSLQERQIWTERLETIQNSFATLKEECEIFYKDLEGSNDQTSSSALSTGDGVLTTTCSNFKIPRVSDFSAESEKGELETTSSNIDLSASVSTGETTEISLSSSDVPTEETVEITTTNLTFDSNKLKAAESGADSYISAKDTIKSAEPTTLLP